MTIYVLYLGLIFFWALWCNVSKTSKFNKKHENLFLNVVWVAMFLMCVLRDPSVGRDVESYEIVYQMTADVPFSDFNYVYFEKGYILLMKICLALNVSFQGFIVVVYAIILVPLYFYIRDFSTDKFLSVLIYVCYIFFEFNMTGIRQAIATSIVLIGYMLYIKAPKYKRLLLFVFITIAVTFHSGAFICYLFLVTSYIKTMLMYIVAVCGLTVVVFFTRNLFMQYIKVLFEKDSMNENAGLYIGLNFLFTFALSVVFVYCYVMKKKRYSTIYNKLNSEEKAQEDFLMKTDETNIKLFLLGITAMILFGSDTAARSYMLLSQTVVVLLPNSLNAFDKDNKRIIKLIVVGFFVVFFFTNTLIPNNFDIVPYKFFWQ